MNEIATFPPPSSADRAPPSDIDCESNALGVMLQENRFIDAVADRLKPADFYLPVHQRMFEVILRERSKGKTVTPVTIKSFFGDDDDIREMGGIAYLARLTGCSVPLGYKENVEQIINLAHRRTLLAGLQAGIASLFDPDAEIPDIVSSVDKALQLDKNDDVTEISGSQCIARLISTYGEEYAGVTCDRIPSIDKLLGPLRPKELIVVAGRPGMGKTAVALSYTIGAARRGHAVCFISLEMSGEQLGARMAADLIFNEADGIPFNRIRDGRLSTDELHRVTDAAGRLSTYPLRVIDTGGLKLGRLRQIVRRQKRIFEASGRKLELVVVDYLQLLRTDTRMNEYEAISEISRTLKEIAKQEDLTVLALAQLSREVEKRPDKRPNLSDLRGSGQIEQDADTVMFLLRQEYYHEQNKPDDNSVEFPGWQATHEKFKGEIEFICAKRRNGRIGTATGVFYGAYQAVRG